MSSGKNPNYFPNSQSISESFLNKTFIDSSHSEELSKQKMNNFILSKELSETNQQTLDSDSKTNKTDNFQSDELGLQKINPLCNLSISFGSFLCKNSQGAPEENKLSDLKSKSKNVRKFKGEALEHKQLNNILDLDLEFCESIDQELFLHQNSHKNKKSDLKIPENVWNLPERTKQKETDTWWFKPEVNYI